MSLTAGILCLCVLFVLSRPGAAVVSPGPAYNHPTMGCPLSLPCDCLVTTDQPPLKLINCTHRDLRQVPMFLELTGYSFDELHLQDNALTSLSKNDFQGLNLTRLVIRNNDIGSVSDNAFVGLTGVRELDMTDNRLESTPVGLQHLIHLTKLVLRNNRIRQLSKAAFASLVNLEELDLSGNPVQFASPFDAFDKLGKLRVLRLEKCSISNLPQEPLRHVSSLQVLDVRRNNITSIPSGIFDHVPNIRELDLESNNIHLSHFHEFAPLRGLKVLKMSHCHLSNISATILRSVPQLQTLVLRHCHIRNVFHGPFRNLLHLSKLDLSGNPRITLTDKLFHGVEERLKYIGIENMNFTAFPTRALRKLFVVKKIKANRNPIRSLPESTFKGLIGSNLEIHLDKCDIFNISSDFLQDVSSPITVSLRENDITSLEFLTERPCRYHGARLDLEDNPIECDCLTARSMQMKAFSVSGRCEGPEGLRDLILMPELGTAADLRHLERGVGQECSLDSTRWDQRYDCACQDWLQLNSTVVCAGQANIRAGGLLVVLLALLSAGSPWHMSGT